MKEKIIFFVNNGILTIDAILDIKVPEESIKRYIYEKFDDIIQIDKENISQQFEKINTGFQNIFNL